MADDETDMVTILAARTMALATARRPSVRSLPPRGWSFGANGVLTAFLLVLASTVAAAGPPGAGLADPPPLALTDEERAWLESHPVVTISAYANYPPAEFLDRQGRQIGLVADYIDIIEDRLGITFERRTYTQWDALLEAARNRDVDVVSLAAKTRDRTAYLVFSEPYVNLRAMMIANEQVDTGLSPADLRGRTVLCVSGYAVEEYLKDQARVHGFTVKPVPNTRAGLSEAAFDNRVVFVSDIAVASYFINLDGISNLHVVGSTEFTYRMGFGIRSDWPCCAMRSTRCWARFRWANARRSRIDGSTSSKGVVISPGRCSRRCWPASACCWRWRWACLPGTAPSNVRSISEPRRSSASSPSVARPKPSSPATVIGSRRSWLNEPPPCDARSRTPRMPRSCSPSTPVSSSTATRRCPKPDPTPCKRAEPRVSSWPT